jgi:PAS domain S-box-containing protein
MGHTMATPGGIERLHRLAPSPCGHAPGLSRTDPNDQLTRPGSVTRSMRDTASAHARTIWAPNESDELLRLAVQVGGIGIYETDLEQGRTRFSPELCAILGLPAETEMTYAEASRVFDERDRASVNASVEAAVNSADEGKWSGVHRILRPDGSIRWVSIQGRRHYRNAADGRHAVRSVGTVVDITHLKETEAALRESEARLRIATNAAALGVFERDVKADRMVWANDRAFEIFGYTRADRGLTRQQLLQDYVHPDDAKAVKDALRDARRKGGSHHVICRIRQKGGLQRWLQIDGRYELTDTGEPSRHIGVFADITERKALEQEARELSERLVNLQEEERQRIAQELHDSTAQHLVAANLNLMSLRAKVDLGSDEMKLWNEVEVSMAEALKELRTFSYLMHPLGLDADGLCATIRRYIDGYANRSGLRVKLRLSQKVDKLSLDMQRAVFRIVQEALANVHRHAYASHVSVDLRWVAGRLHVIVTDNGRGAEGKQEEPVFRPGVGIYGIRARARQFGGDLKIQTGPHGTRIHVVTLIERAQRRKASRVH